MHRWMVCLILALFVIADILGPMYWLWPTGYNSTMSAIDLGRAWIQANLLFFSIGNFILATVCVVGYALYKEGRR